MPSTPQPDDTAARSAPPIPARPEKRATLRFGQREMSRLTLLVILIIGIPLCYGLYHLFLNFRSQRDLVIGQSNMLAIWKAMNGYAADWDGHLPPANEWTDAVGGYLSAPHGSPGGKLAALEGPGDSAVIHYVYNDLAAGYDLDRRIGDPDRLVVLIERPNAPPNAHVSIPPQTNTEAESALLKQLTFPHYSGDPDNATTLILYASGRIERRQRRDFSQR